MSFVSHLESALDGTRFPAGRVATTHEGRPLWVRYDLDAVGRAVRREQLRDRGPSLWRYRELLPVDRDENVVSLGEGMSPLLDCPRLAARLGLRKLSVKDESALPTGSFKARGLCMAVSMAKELGIERLAIPTAGNAGGAMAAYAARAGMPAFVIMPEDTPVVNQYEAAWYGAQTYLADGLIHECAAVVREGAERFGWFDVSTLKEPYRIEGKKTMGLELAEQMDWSLPDVILYPTGGGTGLIGMWKAFAELGQLGWLETEKRPRMFACQASGCAPIPAAHQAGERFAEPPADPVTRAWGLRVPKAVGDFMILDAVRESRGQARAGDESRMDELMGLAMSTEGIALCPEAAIALVVLQDALADGSIDPDEHVVLFNTGAAQKYVENLHRELPRLELANVDWARLADV